MIKYFKSINKNYPFFKLLKYIVLLTTFLLIVDIINMPSKYLNFFDIPLITIGTVAFILILFLTALEFNVFDTFKIVSINLIDTLSIIIIISSVLYGSISIIYKQIYFYKIIYIIMVVILFSVIMLIRGIRFKKSLKNAEKYQPNVIDLIDIYSGNFTITDDKTVLVNEKDVDYDLLERENVINQLYNAILLSNPEGRFVISLEGKWGCGKTTIINNVKKKLVRSTQNIVVIDEFDPWAYSDQESLFFNMFDIILQKSGLRYSALSTKQMAVSLSETIFGSKKTGIIKSLFKQTNQINVLKNRINDYLRFCGKKVVFIIDNIDRTETENIILLFKLVSNVFDFERVTYVLSFDNERVKKIFENELSIDYQYLKKVIQMQIRVPEVDRKVLNKLFAKCLYNLLIGYGEKEQNIKYYYPVIDSMCNQSNDIRDFKRFINSVISIPFSGKNYLNKRDLLVIEYIRLYNLTLYQKIYNNRLYFISHDKVTDTEVFSKSLNREGFNEEAKGFFQELFSKENNYNYLNVLVEIFPYVKKYNDDQDLEYDGLYFSDREYYDIAKNRRICSAKYFDLYFTNTENDFLLIGKKVEDFIERINQSSDLVGRIGIFNKFLESVHPSYHKELFERFQLYLDDLKNDAPFHIVQILFNKINEVDNSPVFFSLDARKRVEIIIWELLQIITDIEYKYFLESIEQEYAKIQNISSILYWFENDKDRKNIDGREQNMQILYKNMGNVIINNSINLYDDTYYYPRNIWGLYRLFIDDQTKVKKYIKKIINRENVFRVLYDIIGLSFGTNYVYSISKSNLDCLTTEEELDEILKNSIPTLEDEQFVLDVYKKYKSGVSGEWEESGIVTNEVKNFQL